MLHQFLSRGQVTCNSLITSACARRVWQIDVCVNLIVILLFYVMSVIRLLFITYLLLEVYCAVCFT